MQQIQNLELKYFCNDFEGIRKALKELGAQKEIVKKQKDYFFNLPTQTLKKGGRMKMRVEGKSYTLTYYERPSFSQAKHTVSKVKLLLGDATQLRFLTDTLGVTVVVEKTREVWRKDNTVFHLDIVKDVGRIFEIELQKKGKLNQKDVEIFESYKLKVLSYLGKIIKGSNEDLVLGKKKTSH